MTPPPTSAKSITILIDQQDGKEVVTAPNPSQRGDFVVMLHNLCVKRATSCVSLVIGLMLKDASLSEPKEAVTSPGSLHAGLFNQRVFV